MAKKKPFHTMSKPQDSMFACLDVENSEDKEAEQHDGSEKAPTPSTTTDLVDTQVAQLASNDVHDSHGWTKATSRKFQKRYDSHQSSAFKSLAERKVSIKKSNWRDHGRPNYRQFTDLGGLPLTMQDVGVIVWSIEVRELHDRTITARAGEEIIDVSDGVRILKKGRMFAMYGRDGREIQEWAIYTHGNTGLANKPANEHDQYMSIRPIHIPAGEFQNQVPSQKVLEIGEILDHHEPILSSNMVVRIAHPKSRDIQCDNLKLITILTLESVGHLLERGRAAVGISKA